jgi:hypothetical protein
MLIEKSRSLFKHIRDIEYSYFSTFFESPNLFDQYYVKESIFSEPLVGKMMKIIEDMYQDHIAITHAELYERLKKQGFEIEYNIIQAITKRYKPMPHDTIYNTIQSIKTNTAKYKTYLIIQEAAIESSKADLEIGFFITEIINKLNAISGITSTTGKDFDDILDQIIMETKSIAEGKVTSYYKTGVKEIDQKMPIQDDNIILVGGPAKHGKSRFVMWIIKLLYENNPDVFATKWYSFEENADEVARKFIAYDTLLTDAEITGKKRKLESEDVSKIVKSANTFKKYDIKIEHAPRSIEQIQAEFQIFVKKYSNKVPILIIDNALLITNDDFNRDDKIMNTLNHIKQRTKAIIFIVHHFNDDQQKEERGKDAFRPTLKDLKGRESYRRVPKVVLLINYPFKYPKIKNKYSSTNDILENMFIVDIAAIRYMGDQDVEGANGENNLIYFYTDLGYNRYYPLSSLHKNNPEYINQLNQNNEHS